MALTRFARIGAIRDKKRQAQIAVRLLNNERGIRKEMDFVYAQKIGAFVRHGNGAAIRSAIIKSMAILPQGHAGKSKDEIVILPWVTAIDEGIVGKIKQHDQMPVASPLGPDAVRFGPIGERLFVIRAGHAPEVPGVGLCGRGGEKPRANRKAEERREKSFHPKS